VTIQYGQQNINNPTASQIVDADTKVTLDDDVIDIVGGNPTLTLPDARTIPSKELVIKSTSGTGTVLADAALGQLIDGAASFTFSAVNEALFLKSNGQDWLIVNAGSSTGSALEIQDEGVTIETNTNLINFVGAGVMATPTAPGEVEVNIPGASPIPRGPIIPEGAVAGSPGDVYIRENGTASSFWQYLGAAPGVTGWVAVGPTVTDVPVGAIDGVNQTFTFPGGVEAVDQTAVPNNQIEFRYNGVVQRRGVDYTTAPGSVVGVTIVSFTMAVVPLPGDNLTIAFIPA
jgi:hypothetical protein